MKWLLLPLALAGCVWSRAALLEEHSGIGLAAPLTKQKQKIVLLQKKLEVAEKEKARAEEEVDRLSQEVHRAQLAMISRQIDSYQQQIQDGRDDPRKQPLTFQAEPSSLFLKERETLHQLIQEGPSPAAFEAQVVLDRILRMITELSDRETR